MTGVLVPNPSTPSSSARGLPFYPIFATVVFALVGLAGCPQEECTVDFDCPVEDGRLTVCEEGVCGQAIDQGCSGNESCGEGGVCEEGLCAYPPECQRLTGSFDARATCDGVTYSGTATAVTDGCAVSLTLPFGDGDSAVVSSLTIGAGRTEPNPASGDCEGTFAAQDGSFSASNCEATGEIGGASLNITCEEVVMATATLCKSDVEDCPGGCSPIAADPSSRWRSCP